MGRFVEYVDIGSLPDAISKALDEWQKDVYGAMKETCDEGIKEAKREIVAELDTLQKGKDKATGRKHYRSAFTTRKRGDLNRILWNRQYPLSHLLEDGHYVYNQFGGPYNIHPYIIKKGKWVYGSKYGTSGKVTKAFGVWDSTERHTSEYVQDLFLKKLK